MRSLVWFRRDLRVDDNRSLYEASRIATEGVIGLYVVTAEQWEEHRDANCKVKFWLENLKVLSDELLKLNIALRIIICNRFEDVPDQIIQLAQQLDVSALYLNHEYEVNESNRDKAVEKACSAANIEFHAFHDRCAIPPGQVTTQDGKFYGVFTPFRKNWESKVTEYLDLYPKPRKQPKLISTRSDIPAQLPNYSLSESSFGNWKPGASEARRRLKKFTNAIFDYQTARDLPSQDGTSVLSPYLAAGVISVRECLTAAAACNQGKLIGDNGPATWISELAWRDFYMHVLEACPRVSRHQPFKLKTRGIQWRENQDDFEAWTQGKTGFPIVDAGMRQLNQTGWMHNRMRMVTAMFLSKNLLIDWRWGEKYFMEKLIDGDLAANNGGWQWSASTGTDSVPYFRIFNPFSQSKRFDSEGTFIKSMCPELSDVPAKALHNPEKLSAAIQEQKLDYPEFIVDYKASRERALDAFKSLE